MSVNGALQAIKADLEIGLNDVAAGRVRSFDTARVIEQGKRLLTARGGFRRVRTRGGEHMESASGPPTYSRDTVIAAAHMLKALGHSGLNEFWHRAAPRSSRTPAPLATF